MTDTRPRYHIDPDALTVISGPHAVGSLYVRKLTKSGNPELLDLLQFNLAPQELTPLAEGQKHDFANHQVYPDRVVVPAVTKTQEELEGEQVAAAESVRAILTDIVQRHLDATARGAGYDDMRALISYLDDEDATFAAQAAAGKSWRSGCWRYLRDVVQPALLTGQRFVPTEEDLLAELPPVPEILRGG